MIKINYPPDREGLESSYLDLFDIDAMQEKLDVVFNPVKFQVFQGLTVEQILTASIEELAVLSESFSNIDVQDTEKVNLHKIFKYDLSVFKGADKNNVGAPYQPIISKFFSENKESINLCSCYFCNIDYISSFSVAHEYRTVEEFLLYASKSELEELEGLAAKSVEYIHEQRDIPGGLSDIESLSFPGRDSKIKEQLSTRSFDLERSQFTLDHFIGKAKNPLVALSLYNFVPSCYACNSRFKGTKDIIRSPQDAFLCATSEDFKFNEDVKFKLFHSKGRILIKNENDFDVRLIPSKNHEEYEHFIRTLKMNSRYRMHKKDALDLILKHRSYRPSYIKAIASLTRRSIDEVQRDIFGRELFSVDDSQDSKSKFKKDIAENIGIGDLKKHPIS